MSTTRFVTSDGLPALLAFLSQNGRRVLVPVEKPANKRSVVYEPWSRGMPFTLEKATVPPKAAVLPQCETLVSYKKSKDPENPERVTMSLDDSIEAQPTVVFACRPCDARGFSVLDRPYLQGPFADPYYKARREALTVVTITCASGCNTCFCHWVGGGPSSPEGSDVLMTEIEGGYVLQAVTPKGEELLAASDLPDGAEQFSLAEAARKAAWATLEPAPNIKGAPGKIGGPVHRYGVLAEPDRPLPVLWGLHLLLPHLLLLQHHGRRRRPEPKRADAACAAGTTACPRCSPARPAATTRACSKPFACATACRTSSPPILKTGGHSPATAAAAASATALFAWTSAP